MKSKLFFQRILVFFCAVILAFAFLPKQTKADEPVTLMTYEDLLNVYSNPAGSYILGADIDLNGVDWKPVDFTGTFNGNGHAILNVNVTRLSDSADTSYDGNMVDYETYFAGFFGTLRNATVSNLKILGINVDVNTDKSCFAGGIAGFMNNSTISGCEVNGRIKVTTTGHCFGTGGIAGFGNGLIENTKADTTLICIDNDVEDKDEQFMGGAYANGYIDVNNCEVHIQGFDSDHGYVHDGGLIGMYILYPYDTVHDGSICNNKVSGFIQFFEDNPDRRAYCDTYIGEIMNWTFDYDDSFHTDIYDEDDFIRDEIFSYDIDVLPCKCGNNAYADSVVESTETTNGYTEHRCLECGYYYRDSYKVVLGNPEPATELETVVDVQPTENKVGPKGSIILAIICAVIFAGIVVIFVLINKKDNKKKHRK